MGHQGVEMMQAAVECGILCPGLAFPVINVIGMAIRSPEATLLWEGDHGPKGWRRVMLSDLVKVERTFSQRTQIREFGLG